jgi:hypothetical protein
MKKVLSLLLALVMCLSLCACGAGIGTSAPSKNNSKKYGAVFLYQHDKWDVYKATQVSETTIKIENWGRFNASEDGDPFKFEYDLCVISTTDTAADFKWLDEEHTAFSVKLTDEQNSYMEGTVQASFAIEATDSSTVFSHQHDKWDLYKAVQLSESTIKIENWGRFDAGADGDPFKHEYDLCIISTTDTTTDFRWLDDSHSAFSITLYDEENSYWEEACVVTFVVATSEE